MKTPKIPKIRCNGCGRSVKDNPDAKLHHVITYHPAQPLKRIIGMFNTQLFELMGYRVGEKLKAIL
jgi:hypothetical protein